MHPRHIIYRLLALCLLLSITAVAKSFVVTSLPTQSQLPVGNIHCIFQDSEGYMWYGTRGGGICRDNGYQIDKFGGKNIICITEDKSGKIWFGTYDGLFYIDKKEYQVRATSYKGETSTLMCDSQGRLWASVGGTIYCINPQTQEKLLENKHIEENAAYFYEDSQRDVWILFWNHKIWKYTGGKHLQPFMPQMTIKPTRIIEDKKQDGYWIATWGDGVLFFDNKTHSLIPQESTTLSLDLGQVLDMKVDLNRNLIYTSTTDNLYIYYINGKNLTQVNTLPFMSAQKKILDGMWIDHSGNLWVGGFIPTTFILSPTLIPTQRYSLPQVTQQTGYPLIADRCIKDGNKLWISQGRIGLMLYNRLTQKLLAISDIPTNSRLITKKRKSSGVWAAKGTTLLSLTANEQLQVAAQNVCSFDSDIMMIRDLGSHLLIGTKTGLYQCQLAQTPVEKPITNLIFRSDKPITQAVTDVDGQIYFLVKNKGLYCHTLDKRTHILCNNAYKLNTMDISPDGTLWLGSEDGKIYTSQPCKRQLVLQEKLCNPNQNSIVDILVDYLRHIWILSDQTVKEVNPENGNMRILHSQDTDIQVPNFYKLEYTGQKLVGIGAAGAYFEISPSLALNNTSEKTYSVIPTSYKIGDSLIIVTQGSNKINIPADESNLTLYMTTNQPLEASKISFAYKLAGNASWVYLPQGINSVYLNSLPVGNCTLLLKSTDKYGRWSEHITEITLYHIPHWWQTIWAKLLFILIGIGILYSLWILAKRIHILSNLQNMRQRLSLHEIEIKDGHEKQALKAEDTLKEIIGYIEANIADANYNVQRLCEDMCMSRTNLYRRIHTVSGLSIIEFIRDIRLKQAALILTNQPDTPITIIHKSVGFTSNSYFTKCFKKKFGITPSEYAKQKATASEV